MIEQNRNRAALRPGDLLLFESSRPFDTYADGGNILIQFPRTLLPLPSCRIERLICRPLPGTQGIGRLLADFLARLGEDGTSYTPHDAVRLGTVGMDLVTATLAHFLEREDDVPADSRQRVLYMRITSTSLLSRTTISAAIGACLLFAGAAAASADTVAHRASAGGTAPACIGCAVACGLSRPSREVAVR